MDGFSIVYIILLAALLLGIAGFTVYNTIRLIRQGNRHRHHHNRRK